MHWAALSQEVVWHVSANGLVSFLKPKLQPIENILHTHQHTHSIHIYSDFLNTLTNVNKLDLFNHVPPTSPFVILKFIHCFLNDRTVCINPDFVPNEPNFCFYSVFAHSDKNSKYKATNKKQFGKNTLRIIVVNAKIDIVTNHNNLVPSLPHPHTHSHISFSYIYPIV